MKVKVIESFLDKNDNGVAYTVGTVLDWNDEARIADCQKRGLVEVIEEPAKKRTTKTKAKQA